MTDFLGTTAGPDKTLVTIDFESLQLDADGNAVRVKAVRHWYHVPRVGDIVVLAPEGISRSQVLNVVWYDDRIEVGLQGMR